jgi:hypothetical protein
MNEPKKERKVARPIVTLKLPNGRYALEENYVDADLILLTLRDTQRGGGTVFNASHLEEIAELLTCAVEHRASVSRPIHEGSENVPKTTREVLDANLESAIAWEKKRFSAEQDVPKTMKQRLAEEAASDYLREAGRPGSITVPRGEDFVRVSIDEENRPKDGIGVLLESVASPLKTREATLRIGMHLEPHFNSRLPECHIVARDPEHPWRWEVESEGKGRRWLHDHVIVANFVIPPAEEKQALEELKAEAEKNAAELGEAESSPAVAMVPGLHLFTRNGAVTGNAILLGTTSDETNAAVILYEIETDFGNRDTLSSQELSARFTFIDQSVPGPRVTPVEEWRSDRRKKVIERDDEAAGPPKKKPKFAATKKFTKKRK